MPGLQEWGFAVAVGGAVVSFLLWSARRQQVFMQRLVENHLTHLTTTVSRLDRTLVELITWLKANK
jgi:hypothetical protein